MLFSQRLVFPLLILLTITGVSVAQAPHFKVLHSFTGGSDGGYPGTTLALGGIGRLYGTASSGGSSGGCDAYGCGAAFELLEHEGHWEDEVLLDFSSTDNYAPSPTWSLVADAKGNTYGTDFYTGDPICNCGAVFQLTKTDGVWTQNILHNFQGGTSDGQTPGSGLVQDSTGKLYGSTEYGGSYNYGTIFELTPNADGTWSYSVIYSFGLGLDGAVPYGPLTVDQSGNVYGTTAAGGFYGDGTAFRLTLDGGTWKETILYNFTEDYGNGQFPDGVVPGPDGNLYGATAYGGEYSLGNIYKLTPTSGFWNRTVLHTFTGNNDGATPYGGLIVDQTGALYGTARYGGLYGYGTVYKVTEGERGRWKMATLHAFDGADGSYPLFGVLADKAGNLYGVTGDGGQYGAGVVFEIVQ